MEMKCNVKIYVDCCFWNNFIATLLVITALEMITEAFGFELNWIGSVRFGYWHKSFHNYQNVRNTKHSFCCDDYQKEATTTHDEQKDEQKEVI